MVHECYGHVNKVNKVVPEARTIRERLPLNSIAEKKIVASDVAYKNTVKWLFRKLVYRT